MLEMDEEYQENIEASEEDFEVELAENRWPFRALLEAGLVRTAGNHVLRAVEESLDGGLNIRHRSKR